jgi:signal transduction histidine kinase/ActR/RegA family two-component response regulator
MTTDSLKTTLLPAQRIENERIYLLFKQSPIGIAATIFNGIVSAYLLRDLIAGPILLIWTGLLLLISLIRIGIVLHYNRNADTTVWASRYKRWNIFTLGVSGFIWGSSAIFLFPVDAIPHQFFLAVVTVGMVAGATMAFSIFQTAFVAFATPALLPISMRLLTTPTEVHFFSGILGLFLYILSLFISRNIRATRLNFLHLKETLAEQVTRQTEALRKANAQLLAENKKRETIQAQLEETRKFEAIANLAGGIAHQFNNALSVILGNTDLINMELEDKDQLALYLDSIDQAAQRMSLLTNQLIAYAKGGKYKPQVVEAAAFVQVSLTAIQYTLPPKLTITTDINALEAKIEIDVTQMQMVISAIVTNAAEATDNKGRIGITCNQQTIESPENDRYGALLPGPYMVMEITDDGVGMNAETQQRIFEPFYTTKFQGRGLGMAAVFGIIKNHQGHIHITSQKEHGTQVRIYLPIATTSPAPLIDAPAPDHLKHAGRILLVEDEPMVMSVHQSLLNRLGYSVIKAPNGITAIDVICQDDVQFDLVLLDLKLPDMDGGAIFPIIRRHRPDVKVIICSGYALEGRTQTLLDNGADGFIQKPFSLDAISAKLNNVLHGKTSSGKNNNP